MNRSWNQDFGKHLTFYNTYEHKMPRRGRDLNTLESFSVNHNLQSTDLVSGLIQKLDNSPDSVYTGPDSQGHESGRPATSFENSSSISSHQFYKSNEINFMNLSTPLSSGPSKKTDHSPDSGYSGSTSRDIGSGRPIASLDNSAPLSYHQSYESSSGGWNSDSFKFPTTSENYNWTVYPPSAFNINASPSRPRRISETGSHHSSSTDSSSLQDMSFDYDISTDSPPATPDFESKPLTKVYDIFHDYFFWPLNTKSDFSNDGFDTPTINISDPNNQLEQCAGVKEMETDCYQINFDTNIVGGKERKADDAQVENNVRETANHRDNFDIEDTRETDNQGNFYPEVIGIKEMETKNSRDVLEIMFQSCLFLTEKLKKEVNGIKQTIFSTSEAGKNSSMNKMESLNIERNENSCMDETKDDNAAFDNSLDISYRSFMKLNAEMRSKIRDMDKRIISRLYKPSNKNFTPFM